MNNFILKFLEIQHLLKWSIQILFDFGNIMIPPNTKPKDVNELMVFAWEQGVKSLYYQRSANPAQELARNIMNCASCQA